MVRPLLNEVRCKCGNRLSVADADGVCLQCASEPKQAAKLAMGYMCACGCGRVVKAYKSKCGHCRRHYYFRPGSAKRKKVRR